MDRARRLSAIADPGSRGTFNARRALGAAPYLALLGIVAILAEPAYERLFSHVNTPDDDGYVILTMRSFLGGDALYDEVYSQFGPGMYALVGGLMDLVGLDVTSDGARWANLFLWLAAVVLAGFATLRLTRNLAVAAATTLVAFFVLSADAYEPLHPGATTAFLLFCLVGAATLCRLAPRTVLWIIGAAVAALVSIKINVGLLAGASVVFAAMALGGALRTPRALALLIAAGFVAAPFVLMAGRLDDTYTLRYAIAVAAGALALALLALRRPVAGPRVGWRDLGWLAAGAACVLAVVSIVVVVSGTSVGGLVDGWVITPAAHPGTTFASLRINAWGPAWALLGVAAAAIAAVRLRDIEALSRRGRLALGVVRLAFGLAVWVSVSGQALGLPVELTRGIAFATPFAWLVVIGRPGEGADVRAVRMLIASLAVLQTLHAFPIPGAQLAWSEAMFVILAALCAADGVADLEAALAPRWRLEVVRGALAALVLAFGAWYAVDRVKPFVDEADSAYASGVVLDLPGAERLRTDAPRAEQLRGLTAGIRRHCDHLITLPGMSSLHLYSGVPPVEELGSPWMLFLDAEDQSEIVDKAQALDRVCAVRKPDLLKFWTVYTVGRGVPDRPLVRFIREEFQTVRNYQGYFLETRARG